MDNKIKHYSATQSIPGEEFLPLLRGESPYFGNLNRPAQSAYNYADTIAEIQSWGGTISILQQADPAHTFLLYEIAQIQDGEILAVSTMSDNLYTRYCIVVAEAEFDLVSSLPKNIVVCTFCPNFVYPITPAWAAAANGTALYLKTPSIADNTFLSVTQGPGGTSSHAPLALKTGQQTIFFCGTTPLFGLG